MQGNKLRINDTYVQSLASALLHGSAGLHDVPALIKRIISTDAWKEREIEKTGKVATFSRFVDFVVAAPLDGLGTDAETVIRLCRDDKDATKLLRDVLKHQGERTDLSNNITEVPRAITGTSRAYTLTQLKDKRPDLHARVLVGELSPHAAAVEAGFRKRTITVPLEPEAAAAVLRRHFTDDQCVTLMMTLGALVGEA